MIEFAHQNWDLSVVLLFNKYCGKCIFLDTLSLVFLSVDALRTAILVALVMGIWNYAGIKNHINSKKRVLSILLSIIITLGIIETLNALIDSPRPIVTYESQINSPTITENTKPLWRDGWVRNAKHGSFPSDTVALLATIAIGIFFWNKLIGFISILFVIITGILPRLYFGLHYPSDMMLGFLIALSSSLIVEKLKFFDPLCTKVLNFEKKIPFVFGTLGFYLAYIIADKFILLRKLPLWLRAMIGH